MTDTGAKKYLLDKVSGSLVVTGWEEQEATQPLLEMLTDEAGWLQEQTVSRPQ